jgi:hypothetical protein
MIHINERHSNGHTVLLGVDGVLDQMSVPVLEEVCCRHLKREKEIVLNLEGLLHITREGRRFLQEIEDRVGIVNAPEFVKLAPRS